MKNLALGIVLFAVIAGVSFHSFAAGTPTTKDIDDPLLVKCDEDPSGTNKARRWTCKNVLDFGPTNPDDYGHSNEDPNDPSNDPKRNHDER